jgi:hypothetical protein
MPLTLAAVHCTFCLSSISCINLFVIVLSVVFCLLNLFVIFFFFPLYYMLLPFH